MIAFKALSQVGQSNKSLSSLGHLVFFLAPEPNGLPRLAGVFDGDGVFFCGLNFGGLGDLFFVLAGVDAAAVDFLRPLKKVKSV